MMMMMLVRKAPSVSLLEGDWFSLQTCGYDIHLCTPRLIGR